MYSEPATTTQGMDRMDVDVILGYLPLSGLGDGVEPLILRNRAKLVNKETSTRCKFLRYLSPYSFSSLYWGFQTWCCSKKFETKYTVFFKIGGINMYKPSKLENYHWVNPGLPLHSSIFGWRHQGHERFRLFSTLGPTWNPVGPYGLKPEKHAAWWFEAFHPWLTFWVSVLLITQTYSDAQKAQTISNKALGLYSFVDVVSA
jgi:hypothetical protein